MYGAIRLHKPGWDISNDSIQCSSSCLSIQDLQLRLPGKSIYIEIVNVYTTSERTYLILSSAPEYLCNEASKLSKLRYSMFWCLEMWVVTCYVLQIRSHHAAAVNIITPHNHRTEALISGQDTQFRSLSAVLTTQTNKKVILYTIH